MIFNTEKELHVLNYQSIKVLYTGLILLKNLFPQNPSYIFQRNLMKNYFNYAYRMLIEKFPFLQGLSHISHNLLRFFFLWRFLWFNEECFWTVTVFHIYIYLILKTLKRLTFCSNGTKIEVLWVISHALTRFNIKNEING